MNLVPQEEPLYNNVVLSPKMDKGNKDIEEKLEKALFDLTDYKNQFWQEKEDMIRTATNFAKPIDENVTPEPWPYTRDGSLPSLNDEASAKWVTLLEAVLKKLYA